MPPRAPSMLPCAPFLGLALAWAAPAAPLVPGSIAQDAVSKFTSSDAGTIDHFGRSMAFADGVLVVGSRYDEHSGIELAGSAYVLESSAAGWVERAKLTADDADVQDLFGHAVAVSGDTVLISAKNDDHSGAIDAGSAYVFVHDGATWVQEAKLTAFDAGDGDAFGMSVALEGDTAIVGAGLAEVGSTPGSGSAYVFVRDGGSWSLQAKLTPSDPGAQDAFGRSVAIEGDTVVVGAYLDDHAGGVDAGSVYVFTRSGAAWSQRARLTPSDSKPGDQFGNAVALSGGTLAVCAPRDHHSGVADAGSVYVWTGTGASWAPEAKLLAQDAGADDRLGRTIHLVGDRLAVGAAQEDALGIENAGAAYEFERGDTGWIQRAKRIANDPAITDNFGSSVAITTDELLVGAPHDDLGPEPDVGSVYAFPLALDCNGNGSPDAEDIATGVSADCNGNGVPDTCDIAVGTALDLDDEGTPDTCQPLAAGGASLSIANGGTLELILDAGAGNAGALYLILGSLAGTSPGLPVDAQILPLNLDAYLLLTLAGSGPIQDAIGFLDETGRASAALALPPAGVSPGFEGQTVHHAFATVGLVSGTVQLTSNAIPTLLAP